MDYSHGKFGDCNLSCFGSIAQTNRQTDRQTDADEHFTPTTLIGVSKWKPNFLKMIYNNDTYSIRVRNTRL